MSECYDMILQTLEMKGFILLNNDERHDSICSLGGGWEDSITLIETGEAFLTKLIDNKTTFLSKDIMGALLCLEQIPYDLTLNEERVLEFLKENGDANSRTLQSCLGIGSKDLNKSLTTLHNKLLVTVVGEDTRLNSNWGTYRFGLLKLNTKESSYVNPSEMIILAFADVMKLDKLSRLTSRRIAI